MAIPMIYHHAGRYLPAVALPDGTYQQDTPGGQMVGHLKALATKGMSAPDIPRALDLLLSLYGQGLATTPESIKTWREEHFLSQADMAALLGVSHATVYRWEQGERAPNWRLLHLAIAYLNLAMQAGCRKKSAGPSPGGGLP